MLRNAMLWWVRRNPTYILSAALVAIGAQQYLRTPDAPAGQWGLILVTFAGLQFYEVAVLGVLTMLEKLQRSLEDRPALLLVAALFWTGPLLASVESLAHNPALGRGLVLLAGLLALAEFEAMRRLHRMRLGWLVWTGCLLPLVLATVAPQLLAYDGSHRPRNEVVIYVLWWVLGGAACLLLGPLRRACQGGERAPVFLGLVTYAVVGFHLWGLSYASFTHARFFYAAPLILAGVLLALEAVDVLLQARHERVPSVFVVAMCAALAVGDAQTGFDKHVPLASFPVMLRDPLVVNGLLVVSLWIYAAIRFRVVALAHLSVLVIAIGLSFAVQPSVSLRVDDVARVFSAEGAACLALYFGIIAIWLGSRFAVQTAIVLTMVSLADGFDRLSIPGYMQLLLLGWAWLAIGATLRRRPAWGWRIVPVIWTVAVGCLAELRGASHGPVLWSVWGTLLVAAILASLVHDRAQLLTSLLGLVAWSGVQAAETLGAQHVRALTTIAIGFGLLGLGAWISFSKQQLQRRLARSEDDGVVTDTRTE